MADGQDKEVMAKVGWPVIVALTLAGLVLTTRSFWELNAYGIAEQLDGSIWTEGETSAFFVAVAVIGVLVAAVLAVVRPASEGLVAGQLWPLRISAVLLFVAAVVLLIETGSPPQVEAPFGEQGSRIDASVNTIPVIAALLFLAAAALEVLMHTSRRW